MKTVQFIFLLALVSAPAWGNNAKVDSLKQLLEQHSTADKAEVLWGIAYELFDVDNAQALFYADRAYHEVWKRGDSLQIVKVGTTYGQLLRRMGKVDQSIEISSRILPIARRHEYRKYWKILLNSLGVASIEKGKYDEALDFNYQSLVLRQEDGDTLELATVLQNIGVIYYKIDDWSNSLDYTLRSIQLIEVSPREKGWHREYLSTAYGNIACVYYEQRRYNEAIKYYRLAKMRKQGRIYMPAVFGWTCADAFLEINYFDSARHYVKEAIAQSLETQNLYAQANAYIVLSKIVQREGNLVQSESYLDSASLINENTDYPILGYTILRQKLNLLAMSGKGHDVVRALRSYERYSDSLDALSEESRINSLQVAFAQRENEAKLKAQSAIMLLQKENLGRQQAFVLVVSTLLISLLILSVALYKANRRKEVINQMLDQVVERRTRELAKHRDALQHLIDEESSRRSRATAELTSILGSLKGLLHLAKVDPGKRGNEYLEKALGLTLQMEGVSQKYADQARWKPQVIPS